MKIALFAADEVGYKITCLLTQKNVSPVCLVLDSKNLRNYNNRILHKSNVQNILYSDHLQDPNAVIELEKMNLDLIILAWWPYLLNESFINIPKIGCLNLHPSLLPFNRGKHPNFWSIIEDVPFGVTIHFIDAGIDTGDIAFQRIIDKTWEDTGETLYKKSKVEIVKLFKNNIKEIISGNIPRIKQHKNNGSFHMAKEIDAASEIKLNEKYEARRLLNILRARTFQPHPGAWFIDDKSKYEVKIHIKKVTNE